MRQIYDYSCFRGKEIHRVHEVANTKSELGYKDSQECDKLTDNYAEERSSLNSLAHLPCSSFETNASNAGAFPAARILLKPAMALKQLRCNSAARSRSCLTVSLVTATSFIVFSNSGTASSRRCAMIVGATWASRKSIIYPSTLTSLASSPTPRRTWLRNSLRSILPRHVSS